MDEFVFAILEGLVGVCIIYIMRYVIPYFRLKLQSVIDEQTWQFIVKQVKSVQQDPMFKDFLGREKKEEVLIRIIAWCNKYHINITQEQISNLIETAVYIMKNGDAK